MALAFCLARATLLHEQPFRARPFQHSNQLNSCTFQLAIAHLAMNERERGERGVSAATCFALVRRLGKASPKLR